jgi:hypothetical protein
VLAQAPAKGEPPELGQLYDAYDKRRAEALKPVKIWYQAQLEALQKKYTQNNHLDAAIMVKEELEALQLDATQDNFLELRKALLVSHWS